MASTDTAMGAPSLEAARAPTSHERVEDALNELPR